MGNDGGDIPRRKELVKERKKQEIATAESIAMGRSRLCNLTNHRFKQPLAICRLGCIYNYENILTALMQKSLPEKYQYIKKLKDIRKVSIERAPETSENFIACPITKLEYNGFTKFVGLWKCGHIVSRKALKQVKVDEKIIQSLPKTETKQGAQKQSTQIHNKAQQQQKSIKKCIICETPYEDNDLIDLNLQSIQMQRKRKHLLETKNKKQRGQIENDGQNLGAPEKKVKKEEVHLNAMDRLGGQFRDVIRQRSKFKQLFKKKES